MAPPTKKPVSQNDLRKLMKERRDVGKPGSTKIDSPLAKYDSLGNLSCSVCQVPIKNQGLWSAHLVSTVHRSSIENLKKVKQASTPQVTAAAQKRHIFTPNGSSKESMPLEKKAKIAETPHNRVLPVASQNILAQGYSSSEESEGDENQRKIQETSEATGTDPVISQLPPGFFDEPPSSKPPVSSKQKSGDQPDTTLPEGFFDDPVLDAKVRKVEYKDPMDEEWEKFQKTITEENNVSQAIIEEDLVESTLDREIDEIDEQIHNWARVEALLQRKESIGVKDTRQDDSGSSSADEQGFEELLDWRAKGAWKKS